MPGILCWCIHQLPPYSLTLIVAFESLDLSEAFKSSDLHAVDMLPDTVHKLPQSERFAYAKLLAYMTRVDNELTVEEMSMFEQRLGTALLSPKQRDMIRASLKNPPTLEECLNNLGDEAGRLALRDAVLMSASDGTVDEDEREALEEIAEHLDLHPDAVKRLLAWTVEGYAWMQAGYDLLNDLSR
ncbi:MAG: TerB family tellurite resistance protein [Candidatus Poseidoniales archaeon]|nr:MAG: TerB family tellurite resistance protein [Candidatus Poseidoniales archaeon]